MALRSTSFARQGHCGPAYWLEGPVCLGCSQPDRCGQVKARGRVKRSYHTPPLCPGALGATQASGTLLGPALGQGGGVSRAATSISRCHLEPPGPQWRRPGRCGWGEGLGWPLVPCVPFPALQSELPQMSCAGPGGQKPRDGQTRFCPGAGVSCCVPKAGGQADLGSCGPVCLTWHGAPQTGCRGSGSRESARGCLWESCTPLWAPGPAGAAWKEAVMRTRRVPGARESHTKQARRPGWVPNPWGHLAPREWQPPS